MCCLQRSHWGKNIPDARFITHFARWPIIKQISFIVVLSFCFPHRPILPVHSCRPFYKSGSKVYRLHVL